MLYIGRECLEFWALPTVNHIDGFYATKDGSARAHNCGFLPREGSWRSLDC